MSDTAGPRTGSRLSLAWSTLFGNEPTAPAVDLALIPVRIVLAWIFVYYGAGKLFGAFNGPGIHATALFFSDTAHLRPGGLFAVLAGVVEFGGAIAIALGLGARLAGLALFGDQVVAMITVTWGSGIGSLTGKVGYEFNLVLAVLALAVAALGAGRLSIDHVIGRRLHANGAEAGAPSRPRGSAEPLSNASAVPSTTHPGGSRR